MRVLADFPHGMAVFPLFVRVSGVFPHGRVVSGGENSVRAHFGPYKAVFAPEAGLQTRIRSVFGLRRPFLCLSEITVLADTYELVFLPETDYNCV